MEPIWKINQRIKNWEKEHKREIKVTKIKDERIEMMKDLGH